MGVSPWKTPLRLFEEKTGAAPAVTPSNWAQQMGIDTEPEARARYELGADCDMPAALVEDSEIPYLRASLDGFNKEKSRVLEIKCPGEKDHAIALEGKIPEKYKWQLVHQLMVTKAREAHYFSYREKKGVIVVMTRDPKLEAELRRAEIGFWALVKSNTPPALHDRDFVEMKHADAPILAASLECYAKLKAESERIATEMESLKAAAISEVERLGHHRVRYENLQIARMTRKGAVDYAKVPALKGVDLEAFRKKGSTYFEIRERKA